MATNRNYSGKCRKINISNLVVCGQWHRTEILKRSVKPSNSTNGIEEVFELYSGSAAKIETISGPEYFGVTNGSDNITHKFYYTFTPKLDLMPWTPSFVTFFSFSFINDKYKIIM